jgi:hypothetical protein
MQLNGIERPIWLPEPCPILVEMLFGEATFRRTTNYAPSASY